MYKLTPIGVSNNCDLTGVTVPLGQHHSKSIHVRSLVTKTTPGAVMVNIKSWPLVGYEQ